MLLKKTLFQYSALLWALFFSISISPISAEQRLRLATTTSIDNSGLPGTLHPPFEKKYGVHIDVIAAGTGKALRLGRNGDVDVVIVHAPAAEISFVEQGFGIERLSLMHNDFIILGPPGDAAQLLQTTTLQQALRQLSNFGSQFVSRGDNSGTHQKEMMLWQSAGIQPQGTWYISAGQGMAAVLQIANDKLAYTLSDRGTYLTQKHRLSLMPVFTGADELFNPYHVIIINPSRHPHINIDLARAYVNFIRGHDGQKIIKEFKIGGEALFKPNVSQ